MKVLNGIDLLCKQTMDLGGKRLGLITVPSGVDKRLESTIDVLYKHYNLRLLFAPEHGIRGNIEAGGAVEDYVDESTGLPVCSLYGGDNRPKSAALDKVDAIVFDVQDVGCRYYTFISTMKIIMVECAKQNKSFIVLDRVNPIGSKVEGNLLDESFASFVGIAAIPQRHGLTVGELAMFFNKECKIFCDLTVIPVEGWDRETYYDETDLIWVNPSPNIPAVDTALLYPGTCLFEGTNLSEGRGTTKPFECIGAPWLEGEKMAKMLNDANLAGVLFRPVYFQPSFSKHRDTLCAGVQAHITSRERIEPLKVGLQMLKTAFELSGDAFTWVPPNKEKGDFFIDLLAGTDSLRKSMDIEKYWQACVEDSNRFKKISQSYRLY